MDRGRGRASGSTQREGRRGRPVIQPKRRVLETVRRLLECDSHERGECSRQGMIVVQSIV